MKNAEFKGKYLTRVGANPESFPVPDKAGLWFVWRTPTNIFLVQPLDQNGTPAGEFFSLDESQFNDLLLPVSHKEEELRSNAQDLLDMWYEQACEKESIALSASQVASEFTFEIETADSLFLEPTFLEEEDSYGLTPSFRTKLKEELHKVRGGEKNQSIDTLTRLLEGKEPLPENGGEDWRRPATFTEIGLIFRREKYYTLALLCHNHALTLAPDDERILFNIARTEFEMGRPEESKKHLKKILSINPHFTVARDFLAFLEGTQ